MRLEKIKSIRNKLQNNQVSLGTWQQIPHASISEILGQVRVPEMKKSDRARFSKKSPGTEKK